MERQPSSGLKQLLQARSHRPGFPPSGGPGTLLSQSAPLEAPSPHGPAGRVMLRTLGASGLSQPPGLESYCEIVFYCEMHHTPTPQRRLETISDFNGEKETKARDGFMRKCWGVLLVQFDLFECVVFNLG